MTDGKDGPTSFLPPGLTPEDAARLAEAEEETAAAVQRQADLARQVRELLEREAADGVSRAKEIHALKHERQMLATQIQHLKVQANHIRYGLG
ncbi:MAG: hypothetical protein KQJ78_09690 [Deltaproteobacteria bacterium]|nr:hypothetical protein [Deltaproteobacteria bacterium]